MISKEAYEYTFTTTFSTTPRSPIRRPRSRSGDSGGGAFEQIGGTWYLVGLIDGFGECAIR